MAALIPDDVLDLFAVTGTYDAIGARIAARYGGLVDAVSLFIPTDSELGPLGEMAQDIGRIPTPFAGYAPGW